MEGVVVEGQDVGLLLEEHREARPHARQVARRVLDDLRLALAVDECFPRAQVAAGQAAGAAEVRVGVLLQPAAGAPRLPEDERRQHEAQQEGAHDHPAEHRVPCAHKPH